MMADPDHNICGRLERFGMPFLLGADAIRSYLLGEATRIDDPKGSHLGDLLGYRKSMSHW